MAKPHLQDSYDAISESDLDAFENVIGIHLPQEYRSFLLQHNGGRFSKEVTTPFDDNDPRFSAVNYFFGIGTEDYADLLENHNIVDVYLPKGFLAVAGDDCGDMICIAHAGRDKGSIWSWDHERGHSDRWPPEDAVRIANNFSEFFHGLRYDDYFSDDRKETIPEFQLAEQGDIEGLKSLLDRGFDINSRNDREETLLICAAANVQSQVVEVLLERGADLHARDAFGRTALFVAAESGSLDSAKLLITAGADLNTVNIDGDTPLLAGIRTYYRVPLYLIHHGANVNLRNHKGESPLGSCEFYADKLQKPLIEAGAID